MSYTTLYLFKNNQVHDRRTYRNAHGGANGAVMRVSPVGILRPHDLNWTELAAVKSAQVTHYDPRCVASAVAVAVAVAMLVTGKSIDDAVNEAARRAGSYHHEAPEYILEMGLGDLHLDEGMGTVKRPPIGFTYKCLGAGFWALRDFNRGEPEEGQEDWDDLWVDRFSEVLDRVLAAGGDVDTNAAVAGALLGAYVGVKNLQAHLVHGLIGKQTLLEKASALWTAEVNRSQV